MPLAVHGPDVELAADLGNIGVDPFLLPCDDLALADPHARARPRPRRSSVTLPLYDRPGEGRAYNLALGGADQVVTFTEIDRRDDWVRINRRWPDGTRVRGWVPRAHFDGIRSWGEGTDGMGGSCGRPLGRGTLRAGASVHTSPGGPAWATAPSGLPVERYRATWGEPDPAEDDDWIRLSQLPGVAEPPNGCAALAHAWVRASDLMPPPG